MYIRKNFYLQHNHLTFDFFKNNYILKIKKFILTQFFFYKFINSKFFYIVRTNSLNILFFNNLQLEFIIKFYNFFFRILDLVFFRKLSFFSRFMYCISVGLGFRKRIRSYFGKRFLIIYMGTRHWLAFHIPSNVYIFPFKRGSLIFFSESKYLLNDFLKHLQHVRRELVFKIKGFYLRRLKVNKKIGRTWSFARRVKFKRIKTKLSKKQKFI